MSILVTGATGTIGSQVLAHVAGQTTEISALTRSPETAKLPAGVKPIGGDLADVDSLRAAMKAVDTLFLLAPNVADELTQAMLAGDTYADVPHFAGKYTEEATKTERAALVAELQEVETTDIAYDIEEHSVGICAIGTAFRDSLGREFSLSIPVPAARFAGKRLQLSKMLKEARADLIGALQHI
jgi:hypothetical protein